MESVDRLELALALYDKIFWSRAAGKASLPIAHKQETLRVFRRKKQFRGARDIKSEETEVEKSRFVHFIDSKTLEISFSGLLERSAHPPMRPQNLCCSLMRT